MCVCGGGGARVLCVGGGVLKAEGAGVNKQHALVMLSLMLRLAGAREGPPLQPQQQEFCSLFAAVVSLLLLPHAMDTIAHWPIC
jgi:hypothetical protein